MSELSIPRFPKHQQLLFPEIEHHLQPFTSPGSPIIYDAPLSPFSRGPMYRAYADLRDWKLRMKKKTSLSPSPIQLRLVPEFSNFRKDSLNTRPPVVQRFDSSKTPPPPPSINETNRFGSLPSGKGEEKRGGGPPRAGSGRADEFLLMRGFSSYDESTSRNKEEGSKTGRSVNPKGILRKTFTGFRRPTAKTNTSLG